MSGGDAGRGVGVGCVLERARDVTAVQAVLAITAAALLARLVFLGARTAHWDEARVAYWAYYYAETGSLAYHWEEHGPLVQILARWLFELFGVGDVAARLPVAVVGGLLPLGALLVREHLRDSETVALALFLAGNSILLYYSRFLRSDVLVAAFMFAAFGMLVRLFDTRRLRYLYGAALFFALGFGSKENAVIYLLVWAGAGAVLTDQWLHSPASDASGLGRVRQSRLVGWLAVAFAALLAPVRGLDSLRPHVGDPGSALARAGVFLGHLLGALVVFLASAVVLFAPRGEGFRGRRHRPSSGEQAGLGLAEATARPAELPGFASETLTSAADGYREWFGQTAETTFESYLSFLGEYVALLFSNATALFVFAGIGIALERYAREDSRTLVMFASYWGVASLFGYPLGSHIAGDWAWISVHVVVALAVPAAVGVAWLYRAGRDAVADRDGIATVAVSGLLVLAAVNGVATGVTGVYTQPQAADNPLVQFAQPGDDMRPLVEDLEEIAADNEGTDVVIYYGEDGDDYDGNRALVLRDGTNADPFWDVRPVCSDWANTQPLNWYLASTGATATCERDPGDLATAVESDPPPVVVGVAADTTLPRSALEAEYERRTYHIRTDDFEIVVYTHESWR